MGGTYRLEGDYLIPNLVLTDSGNYQIENAADPVGKGTDTFEPAFRVPFFQSNLKITFRCFSNQSINHWSVPPDLADFSSPDFYRHYTGFYIWDCKIRRLGGWQ